MIGIPMAWQERPPRNTFALIGYRDGERCQLALVKRIEEGRWLWMVRLPDVSGKVCGTAETVRHAMLQAETLIEEHGGMLMRSHTMACEHRLTAELNLLGVLASGKDSSDKADAYRAWRDLAELKEIFRRCGYEAGHEFLARHDTLRSWVPEN